MAEKYHVNRSMDELGVASSCWDWVPEPQTKQMVYEATGNRQQASRIVVKHWASREAWARSGAALNDSTLLVDVPAIMNSLDK